MTDTLTLLLEFLGGVALLAVAAWMGWRFELSRRGTDGVAKNQSATRKLAQKQARRDARWGKRWANNSKRTMLRGRP